VIVADAPIEHPPALTAPQTGPITPAMSTPTPILFIGNKNYSSWSMRPWLALRWAGIAFEERLIPLGGPGYGKSKIEAVLAVSPSGKVPALQLGDTTIWDSLAICEWAAEQNPALWPQDPLIHALARSAAAEMHSGFPALRRDFSMNLRRKGALRQTPAGVDAQEDIARVDETWRELRSRFGGAGPYLFGARSIADAMYAPVATRFRSYGVALSPPAQAYANAVLADPAFQEWDAAAQEEPWTIPTTDAV
jgi:glutathione S-transferase